MIKQYSVPYFMKELHQQILCFYLRVGGLGAIEIFNMPVRNKKRNRKQHQSG